jgi:hypothetical protein
VFGHGYRYSAIVWVLNINKPRETLREDLKNDFSII